MSAFRGPVVIRTMDGEIFSAEEAELVDMAFATGGEPDEAVIFSTARRFEKTERVRYDGKNTYPEHVQRGELRERTWAYFIPISSVRYVGVLERDELASEWEGMPQ